MNVRNVDGATGPKMSSYDSMIGGVNVNITLSRDLFIKRVVKCPYCEQMTARLRQTGQFIEQYYCSNCKFKFYPNTPTHLLTDYAIEYYEKIEREYNKVRDEIEKLNEYLLHYKNILDKAGTNVKSILLKERL